LAQARLGRSEQINGWLFVMPALVLLGLFMIYPILWSLWMSFQTGRGMNFSFGGIANIVRLTQDPVFQRALTNTFIFLIVQVPIMLVLALLFAAALNDPSCGSAAFFAPPSSCPASPRWSPTRSCSSRCSPMTGSINDFLLAVGLIATPIPWLADPFWAKVVVILAITWRWTGYNMIFYLAAMQNIDRSIYEAARIDGVPAWARFWHITVPMLKPVILFTSVISTIGTLQLFDEVNNHHAKGGPSDSTLTLSLYIYNLTFKFMPSFGYAATVSYVIVVLVGILSFIQFVVARDRR
jgi:lactose/L-arabinose transport system permease protein